MSDRGSFFNGGANDRRAPCWCGRQKSEHYALLVPGAEGKSFCRKGSRRTFVAMPDAFRDPRTRAKWEEFVDALDDVPGFMAELAASFAEWRTEQDTP